MIAPGIRAALAVAYDALAAAERAPDRMASLLHLRRANMALMAMEAEAERVAILEASPIAPHWLRQPVAPEDYPENVVPLRRVHVAPYHHGGAA